MAEDCQYVCFSDSSELLPLVCLFAVVFLNVAMSVKLPIKLMQQTHLSAQTKNYCWKFSEMKE